MDEALAIEKITEILRNKGFRTISFNEINIPVNWAFDIFAEKKDEVVVFEYRKNDRLLDIFFQRLKDIKKFDKKLSIYLVFERRPKGSVISKLSSLGIGIMLFQKDKIFTLSKSKDFSKKKPKKIIKKPREIPKSMHQIFVYVSSRQYENDGGEICKERGIICNIIHDFYRRHQLPVTARLVEYDRRDRKINEKIRKNLHESHLFVCALREEFSGYVDYEVKKAFDIIRENELILILKKNMPLNSVDKKQIKLIEYIENKDNYHLPYSNLTEFEDVVYHNLLQMIEKLYNRARIKSPLKRF